MQWLSIDDETHQRLVALSREHKKLPTEVLKWAIDVATDSDAGLPEASFGTLPVNETPEPGKLYMTGLPSSGFSTVHGLRAIDGDTFEAAFLVPVVVRLCGVNAPERGQPGSAEATTALNSAVSGKLATLKVFGREKYGRLLADVWSGSGWISEEFVKKGLAVPYSGGKR